MELTPEEKERCIEFSKLLHYHKDKTERIETIIKMSKDGKSIPEIHEKVGGAKWVISETRMKARRAGII